MDLDTVRTKLEKISSNRNKIPIANAYRKILELNGDPAAIQEELEGWERVAMKCRADEMYIATYKEFLVQERVFSALGLEGELNSGNEVYAIDPEEQRVVRLGFLADVLGMSPEAIQFEYEAELTAQEVNEEDGSAS